MIIPYQVDVPLNRWPIANYLILGFTVVAFVLQWRLESLEAFILKDWTVGGLMGYIWVHGGIIHLVGNLIFLWIFGNAVCAKVGNLCYPLIYLCLGMTSGAAHLIFDGAPAIGASGAINGIVGMYLVWYPLNSISCVTIWLGEFTVDSFWMILLWLAFDIWGAASDSGGVAYFAHLGGFATGFGLAIVLLRTKMVEMDEIEKSLLRMLGWHDSADEAARTNTQNKDEWAVITSPGTDMHDGSDTQDETDTQEGGEWTIIADPRSYADFVSGTDGVNPVEKSQFLGVVPTQAEVSTQANVPTVIIEQKPVQPTVMPKRPFEEVGTTNNPVAASGADDFIRLNCVCGKTVKAPAACAGKAGRCPRCARKIFVPQS